MTIREHINRRHRLRQLTRMAAVPHKKVLPPLSKVHSIGIVLPHDVSETDTQVLAFFVEHMVRRNIMVTQYRLPLADDKENTDKWGFPSPESLATFSSYCFDIIIAIAPNDDHGTLYTVLSTPARLRIAYDDTQRLPNELGKQTFDLFIRGTGQCNTTDYLKEILTLLLHKDIHTST